ncbi:MAG: sulfotransferase [Kiloniellales bacterium]|nr:sulfotransferase [Kiloniellales bacterium]
MSGNDIRAKLQEGVALQKSGELLRAARCYSAVLETEPRNPDAWHLLGTIEIQRQNLEQAFGLVRKALAIDPENATYHHNLAYLMGAVGRLDEAVAHYRRAVALKPDYAEAYFNLSGSTKFAAGDPVLPAIQKLIKTPGLSDEDQCFLHFAAGKVLDDIGDYDGAFAHYRQGNAKKGKRFDRDANRSRTDEAIALFDAALLRRRAARSTKGEELVFVVGMPRSGTSLVEQVLASHPAVHGAGELPDIDAIAGALAEHNKEKLPYPDCIPAIDGRVLSGFGDAYLERVRRLAPDSGRFVDKAPLNFRYLGLIGLMLPGARVLHCRRDPVDTCLSGYFQNFAKGQDYAFELGDLAAFYRDYRRFMEHWRAVLPLKMMELDYEALVADQKGASRALLAFCGLEWDEACTAFHRTERPVQTASRWQVRQPIYRSSMGRWRRYKAHLGPLLEGLGGFAPAAEGEGSGRAA